MVTYFQKHNMSERMLSMQRAKAVIVDLFHSKSFKSFFVSYIFILVAILLMNSVYYSRTADMLFDESIRVNSIQADQFAATMEHEVVGNALDSLVKLEKTYDFTQLLNADYQNRTLDRSQIYQMRSEMSLMMDSSMQDLFLLFHNQQLVVPAPEKPTSEASLYYDIYYGSEKQSYLEWRTLLTPIRTPQYGVVYDRDGNPCLLIQRALPTSARNNLHVTGAAVMSYTMLTDFMESAGDGTSAVAIYDRNNIPLLTSDESITPMILPDDVSDEYYTKVQHDDLSVYVAVRDSELLGCRYVSIVSEEAFTRHMTELYQFQWGFTLLVFLAGVVIAFILARRSLQPIRDAVQVVADSTEIGWDAYGGNELEYLKGTISDVAGEYRHLQKVFDRKAIAAQQSFLFEALHDGLSGAESLRYEFAKNRIPCLSEHFAVILLRATNNSNVRELGNECRLIAQSYGCIAHILMITMPEITCLLNTPTNADEKLLDDFCGQFAEKNLFIARSAIHTGIAGLTDAYRQAHDVQEYFCVHGMAQPLTPELCGEPKSFRLNPRFYGLAEADINGDIRAAEYSREDALNRFDALLNLYSDDHVTTPQAANSFAYDLRTIMVSATLEHCDADSRDALWNSETLFHRFTCLDHLRASFVRCMLAANADYRSDAPERELSERVVDYLNEHYADPNLSLASLSQQFGISSDYLSSRFRQQAGHSINDELAAIRVEEICDRLAHTDKTLEEIAAEVGLLNSSTLIRLFKKIKGTTPGAYRKQHQDEF